MSATFLSEKALFDQVLAVAGQNPCLPFRRVGVIASGHTSRIPASKNARLQTRFISTVRIVVKMASQNWWEEAESRVVAVVTGGNKGIGFEIVRQLLLRTRGRVTVVLTARSEERGREAVVRLKSQLQTEAVEEHALEFHPLDVTSVDSVAALAEWLRQRFNGIDILINNAAISYTDINSYSGAQMVLDTNYEGVKRVTKGLLPIMRPSTSGARIVNVSSSLGQLKMLGTETLREEMADLKNLSEEKIDRFVARYLEDVKAGNAQAKGWPSAYTPYVVSKVVLNAYTRVLAAEVDRQNRREGQKLYVNCMNPGYTKTDLNDNRGVLTTEEGADTAVWLALLPPLHHPQGMFFDQRRPQNY